MTDDLDALASDLAEFDVEKKLVQRSPVEERLVAGFEDIQHFVEKSGHQPRHGPDHDIFERLYAVRLNRLAGNDEYRALLESKDYEPPRVYRRVFRSNLRLLYQVCSGFHRMPPPLLVA
jgi:hypothetical protein